MFEPSLVFLRVRGIPIGAHWSWLLVAGLVVWSLGGRLFPRTYPGLDGSVYWIMAAVAATLFFGSVLLHELGHALTAVHNSLHIEGITLWLFGGVARFKALFPSPNVELAVAVAGPLISLGLALAFAGAAWAGGTLGWPEPVRGIADYLARINAIVLGFNLVPALPLDGGRLLRAYLWRRQDDFVSATLSAAKAGRIFGMVLIGVGILGLFTGASTGSIWIAFIGWFLLQAAGAEAAHAVQRHAFSGLTAGDLMTADPETVPPSLSVEALLDRLGGPRGHSTYPVVEGERLAGLVSIKLAARTPKEERHVRRVADVMVPRDEVPVLAAGDDVQDAIERIEAGGLGRAVVLDGDRLTGIVSRADLARALERKREAGGAPAARPAGVLVWVVVGLAMAAAAGYLYHPPLAVLRPGDAIDITKDIRIDGIEIDRVNGRYLLTSVSLSRPNALAAGWAFLHPDQDVVSLSSVIPEGVDPARFAEEQRAVFDQSRMIAAIAAAEAAGMDVVISGDGAEVAAVVPGSPAAGALERGDVIVAVDGRPVEVAQTVGEEISTRPAGTRFTLTVERDGEQREAEVRSTVLEDVGEPVVGIGVLLRTRNFNADLPFEVSFESRQIGGPSAGLAYALAIYDLIEPGDLAGGRTVAATGTIAPDGGVGRVGGISKKAAGASDAGADLFLVPRSGADQARGSGIPVRGVQALEDALRVLRATA